MIMDNGVIDTLRVARPDRSRVELEGGELLRRSKFLLKPDRQLIELCVRGGISRRQMGELLGLPGGTVSRRIQKILARLQDPISAALLDPSCPLADEYRQLGIEHFVQGHTVLHLADLHRMKRPAVTSVLDFIRGWQRGLQSQRIWQNAARLKPKPLNFVMRDE